MRLEATNSRNARLEPGLGKGADHGKALFNQERQGESKEEEAQMKQHHLSLFLFILQILVRASRWSQLAVGAQWPA